MDAGRPRFEADRKEREKLAERFFDALREETSTGCENCSPATCRWSGRRRQGPAVGQGFLRRRPCVPGARRPPPFIQIGGVVEMQQVNGQPGAIFRDPDGKVLNTWTLDILDGRIQTIRTVSNPDKLGHMGPRG